MFYYIELSFVFSDEVYNDDKMNTSVSSSPPLYGDDDEMDTHNSPSSYDDHDYYDRDYDYGYLDHDYDYDYDDDYDDDGSIEMSTSSSSRAASESHSLSDMNDHHRIDDEEDDEDIQDWINSSPFFVGDPYESYDWEC